MTRQIQRYQSELRPRSEEHTSELQSQSNLVCRLLLEKTRGVLAAPRAARADRPLAGVPHHAARPRRSRPRGPPPCAAAPLPSRDTVVFFFKGAPAPEVHPLPPTPRFPI